MTRRALPDGPDGPDGATPEREASNESLPELSAPDTSSRRIAEELHSPEPISSEMLAVPAASLGPNHAVGFWNDVLLSYFPREVTIEALAAVHTAHAELNAAHPSGTVTLGVVGSGIAIPRPDVRAYAARIAREASATIRGECIVIEGHPFWVGMARSTLRTIELLSASWHPRQVFGSLVPAAEWTLERSTRSCAEPSELVGATESLVGAWMAAYGGPTAPAGT